MEILIITSSAAGAGTKDRWDWIGCQRSGTKFLSEKKEKKEKVKVR